MYTVYYVYGLNENVPSRLTMFLLRVVEYLTTTITTTKNTRHEKPTYELLVRVVQETPKKLLPWPLVAPRPPVMGGKLNTPCTLNTGPRGPKLDLT